MVLVPYYVFTIILTSLATITATIVIYYKWAFTYWKGRNVQLANKPIIPYGNYFFDRNLSIFMKSTYQAAKSMGLKHTGFFVSFVPVYLPIDLNLIKTVMQPDFSYFADRGFYINEKDDPLSTNLVMASKERWQKLKRKLSPCFSATKIQIMFDAISDSSHQLQKEVDSIYKNQKSMNINDVSFRYATNATIAVAFGLDFAKFKCDALEILEFSKKAFDVSSKWRIIQNAIGVLFPNFARSMKIKAFSSDINNFFINMTKNAVQLFQSHDECKSVLQYLIKIENYEKNTALKINELAIHIFTLFLGGIESPSSAITFCLYELATNFYIQNRLRNEINCTLEKHEGLASYDAIKEMKYMNQVVKETLRKYPPISSLPRMCVKDYKVPGTEVVIEKDTLAFIPVIGLHHDPEYYPEPDKFDPERFSEENNNKRPPFTYIPFGDGPKMCLGRRFGMLIVKSALVTLVKHYKFSLNKETITPIQLSKDTPLIWPQTAVLLDMEKVADGADS